MRIRNENDVRTAPMAPQPAARPLLGVARSTVTWGQVFRRYNADGTLGDKKYAAVGKNGRFYSINIGNAEVAAADDGDARVKVIGSWKLNMDVGSKAAAIPTTRRHVNTESLFTVKGGKRIYANLGRLRDGKYIALNPASQDYSLAPMRGSADKSNKNVVVVGSYDLSFKLNAGER